MKRGRSLVMALAVMVLAPLPLLAQGGGQGAGRGMGGAMSARLLLDQGSVEYLVTKATDLTLDADQTKKLTELGAAWAAATKDSRESIRKELPQPGQGMGGDREAMMQKMQALQPVMQKLAEDDQKSLDEAMKVLSADQQTKAKTLLEERRQNARPRRPGGNG